MRIDGFSDSYLNRIYPDNIPSSDKIGTAANDGADRNEPDISAKAEKESAWDAIVRSPRRNADIKDVRISLGNRDHSLVGLSNLGGIQSSLMRKAVSDMQKDSVLHEYQYFVGSGVVNNRSESDSSSIIMNDEDGLVIRK